MNSEVLNETSPSVPAGGEHQTEERNVFDPEAAWQVLVRAVLEHVTELANARLPAQGIFQSFGFGLGFPGEREIHGILFVEPGSEKTQRVVRVSAHRKNSDRLVSNYFFFDSTQQLYEWLKAEETILLLVKTYQQLRKRIE